MPDIHLPVHPDQSARLGSLNGLPVREDTLYTNHKGEEKKDIRKRAEETLDKLNEILRRALQPDETVLYVARCQAPAGSLEQLTLGWYIYRVTATVLVFTNRRILQFLIKSNGTWKRSLRSVLRGDVEEAKVKGWLSPTLQVKYRNGKKETFWRLCRDDAKKIKMLWETLASTGAGEGSPAETIVSLCPNCLAALTPAVYECSRCGTTFKNEKTMVRRSLLIPGGGYFYVGQWFLGIGDFIVEAYLLLFVAMMALYAGGWAGLPPEPGESPPTREFYLIAGAFFAAILVVEKLLTIHHCRRFIREFIPTK